MLSFFPSLYKDELLYSALARFHLRSGNNNYKKTLSSLFGNYTSSAITDFPGNLNALCSNIGEGVYNPEKIINNHTLFPYYKSFIEEELVLKLTEQMIFGDSKSIFLSVGGAASRVKGPDYFRFCLNCFNQEQDLYGEAYWHRTHQLPGVMVCPIHKEFLFVTDVPFRNQPNRQSLITLDKKIVESNSRIKKPTHLYNSLLFIAEQSNRLLNDDEILKGPERIRKYYFSKLQNNGYVTVSNRLRMRELTVDFLRILNPELLKCLFSNFDKNDEDTWFHRILRKSRYACHPLRHILILYFLNEIFPNSSERIKSMQPFGEGPWPCLNKAAIHYKENIIHNCIVTRDSKTNLPVGTFKCEDCQFTYARKGPDSSQEDKYKIGRVKVFGNVWEDKLSELYVSGRFSVRKIASTMGVDSKTINKYVRNANDDEPMKKDTRFESNQFKEEFIKLKVTNPLLSRTQLRLMNPSIYMWLYRNEKEWLFENLPLKKRIDKLYKKVNWNQRDKDFSFLILQEAIKIYLHDPLTRITKTRILNNLDLQTLIRNNMNKLPLCQKVLEDVTESVEEFQVRRIRYNAEKFRKGNISYTKSSLIRASNLRSESSEYIKSIILDELKDI